MRFVCLTILTLFFFEASAQNVSQVVEKVVERTIDAEGLNFLELRSEKAEVFISRGEPGKISIKLIFTASYRDKSVAELEMRFHKYAFGSKGNIFFLQQTYLFRDVKKVYSKLTARIELIIPPGMDVSAFGEYADFTLHEGSGSNDFRMRFGKLTLDKITGATIANTKYSDIEINKCTGKINIVATRGDILIKVTSPITTGNIRKVGSDQILDAENFQIQNISGSITIENVEP